MTVDEAQQSYRAWKGQLDAGLVSFDQYTGAISLLRGSDASGSWMIDPQTGAVLCWDGISWSPATWTAPAAYAAPPPAPQFSPPQTAPPPPYGTVPPPPLTGPYEQPQYGYQSSALPPALPYAQANAQPQKTPWSQGMWDVLSVAGNSAMAAAWYWYSGLDRNVKPDYMTCASMVILPILLIVFREKIDGWLQPVQALRAKLPPMVLLGTGAAAPLLVANFLNAAGVYNYPFMLTTYLISTILSYVLLRQPPRSAGPVTTGQMRGTI